MNLKVVQTELPEEEYYHLRKAVKEKKLTLKEGVRQAVRQWIEIQMRLGEDPLFKLRPVRTGAKTNSVNLDKELYCEPRPCGCS